jgi:superfamily II DNA helicase RecQ
MREDVGVSPLIALIRDPVEALNQLGVRAEFLNSSLTQVQIKASEQKVPPFVIFHDITLLEMVQTRSSTITAFGQLSRVGKAKLERYADSFLAFINKSM